MKQGDQNYTKAFENENMKTDLIYDALDNYNNSIKLTFEVYLEIEAISNAQIGKLQYRAFKNNMKAKQHYNDVVRLCEAMKPKIFTEEKWYQLMMKHMQEIHQEEQRLEAENAMENEAEIRQECTIELEKLDVHMKRGAAAFLKHVVKNYKSYINNELPATLSDEDLSFSKIKKTLVKLTKHYHPDKINTLPAGTWSNVDIYLRSQIIKIITNLNSEIKGL